MENLCVYQEIICQLMWEYYVPGSVRRMFRRMYVLGCPCHILHNRSLKAAAALSETTGFHVYDLAVEVSYWFDNNAKRKAGLEELWVL